MWALPFGGPKNGNNIIQKGLAFRCETSGSVCREPWLAPAPPAAVTLVGLARGDLWTIASMMTKISYNGYRFPPVIIQQAIWLYARFTLSFRDVEDLLAERGVMVSYETVRRWVNHFGSAIAADLRKRRPSGILMRSLSKSMAGWSTYGAPSMPKAKSSTFLCRASGTSELL
jgi:hypothetical protein